MPFPLNLGAIATGVASVLSGIVSAKQILGKVKDGPQPNIDTNVSADGGGGQDAQPQGLDLGAPNIQAIDQPTIGQQAPTQAYVIESDISDAQALQQELDLQSTL